jgi:hypothetical protein
MSKTVLYGCHIDKCFLVLIHTPLFMFVRLLALLISNHFICFVCFVINRSLHHILTKGAKMDLKPRERSGALPKCIRAHLRSHARLRSNAVQSACISRGRPWRLSAVNRMVCVRLQNNWCVRTQARNLHVYK